jgi:uncharacterized membrane protein
MKLTGVGRHRSARSDEGQIIVFSALIIAIVLGMGALAVDVGFYLHERQNVQKAVDLGALAGAQLLPNNALTADSVATTFTLANDPSLDPANVTATFRCLVGDRNHDGVPHPSDIPSVCDPKRTTRYGTRRADWRSVRTCRRTATSAT